MSSFIQNIPDSNTVYNDSYLFDGNAEFLENIYSEYLQNPSGISENWRILFDNLRHNGGMKHITPEYLTKTASEDTVLEKKQAAVLRLIHAYRTNGHQLADIDPLGLYQPFLNQELEPGFYGLEESDLNLFFYTSDYAGAAKLTLSKIIETLKETYCSSFGIEYMHLTKSDEREFLQRHLEGAKSIKDNPPEPTEQIEILTRLIAAETLERYLNSRYQGQKRFSLEGAESLIPLLDEIIRKSGNSQVQKVVIGMSHRGRLNVLINIIGKSLDILFREFEGNEIRENNGDSGDVKYHLGYTSNLETPGGSVHISLASNPSHLEFINPVVEGAARSRQRRLDDKTGEKVLPVLIHGDAAFCSQGVVMETLQMTQTQGYTTGGTLHIVVNNQIGFTKNMPIHRSFSTYCTEIGKIAEAPIFHVNADYPETVLFVTKVAFDFRMKFKKDIILDLVCYRRHGHNETDEPRVTQPMMYKKIDNHPSITQSYGDRLVQNGIINKLDIKNIEEIYRQSLDKREIVAPHILVNSPSRLAKQWIPHLYSDWRQDVDTKISMDQIRKLSEAISHIPDEFEVHRAVKKIIENRKKMGNGDLAVDWGFAELMAYASLLHEGYNVRLSGQDSSRGTFFHRHAILYNQNNESRYTPLQNIPGAKGHFIAIDSLLSEAAVLGFEYGFSIGSPDSLVIWEAQFGDFANGAQVIIDQFIASGETKWERLSGLTLFLPHGYDGQGPEHSSARLERFLMLAAENNIQVCIPTLPSQMFHMLRRQMLRNLRKPLIVMTPKSLLRNSLSTSSIDDLTNGQFENIIGEIDNIDAAKVQCIVVCCGKIYFELLKTRRERSLNDLAIIRIEQLYPFPTEEFQTIIKKYPKAKIIRWCQEEPENQGAWNYMQKRILENMESWQDLEFVARPPSASPAVGNHKKHVQQQETIINHALKIDISGGIPL